MLEIESVNQLEQYEETIATIQACLGDRISTQQIREYLDHHVNSTNGSATDLFDFLRKQALGGCLVVVDGELSLSVSLSASPQVDLNQVSDRLNAIAMEVRSTLPWWKKAWLNFLDLLEMRR